jgi:hypothetical protein
LQGTAGKEIEMLTPQQKAQLGIGLVQEAIVQVLTAQGNSALQTDIQQNLGFTSTNTVNAGLVGTLLADLANQNIVRAEGQGNQTRIQLLAAQTTSLGKTASGSSTR